MNDYWRAVLAQRTVLVPAVCGIIGVGLHARGLTISDQQSALLQQEVAAVFDVLAMTGAVSSARYSLNQQRIQNTSDKVKETAEAVNVNADILDPETPTPNFTPARVDPTIVSVNPSPTKKENQS
jgi:tetrahydromethanopterin S-methyltransferase subunit B